MEWNFSLQPLADSECVIMQPIDPGKGCSSLPPTFTFWEGGRTFGAGRRNALGAWKAPSGSSPGLPPVSKFTSTPALLTLVSLSPALSLSFQTPGVSSYASCFCQTAFPQHFLSPSPWIQDWPLVMVTAEPWGEAERLQVPTAWVPGLVLPLASWENPAKLLTVPQALVSSSVKWE